MGDPQSVSLKAPLGHSRMFREGDTKEDTVISFPQLHRGPL